MAKPLSRRPGEMHEQCYQREVIFESLRWYPHALQRILKLFHVEELVKNILEHGYDSAKGKMNAYVIAKEHRPESGVFCAMCGPSGSAAGNRKCVYVGRQYAVLAGEQ